MSNVGRFSNILANIAIAIIRVSPDINAGKPSTFDVAYPQKLKLYIKLQLRKPKDKNYEM
jgi:hypothetical protein